MREQLASVPRILACYQVDLPEGCYGTRRHVLKVAYRRGDEI